MLRTLFATLLTLCFFSNFAIVKDAIAKEQCVYVSSGGKITVYQLNQESGELKTLQQFELPGAGPLTANADQTLLYATANAKAGNKKSGSIATLKVAEDGKLSLVKNAPVNIRGGYLCVDKTKNFMAGNHYGDGKITIWKLENEIYQGETVQELTLEKNAHSSVFSPNNKWLLVPATGPNKVFQNRFDEKTGKATPNDPPFASGPSSETEARQPRHLVFHPTLNIVYTTNERELPGVGVWSWNPETGQLKTIQNLISLPEGFQGTITTADVHITPNAKFVYISNRDNSKRNSTSAKDSIVGFSVDAKTGLLTMIGHTACEHIPRSFDLDQQGEYAFVAGQGDGKLGVYRIDQTTGKMSKVNQYEPGASPSWVHCMFPHGK